MMNNGPVYSAHQLHYLPWLAYFFKIQAADKFVFADDVQYKSHNFINRAQIKTAGGKQWLTIPVLTKGKQAQLIRDVRINTEINWRRKHWKSLIVNYKTAPWFEKYADFFAEFYAKNWTFLFDANFAAMKFLLEALSIKTNYFLSSEFDLEPGRTERIIDMGLRLQCRTYLSGPSGKKYMDLGLFEKNRIGVEYLQFQHPQYSQQFGVFQPAMSVIDLLFNEGPNAGEILAKGKETMRQ